MYTRVNIGLPGHLPVFIVVIVVFNVFIAIAVVVLAFFFFAFKLFPMHMATHQVIQSAKLMDFIKRTNEAKDRRDQGYDPE